MEQHTTPTGDPRGRSPLVAVRAFANGDGWDLVITACPYCGQPHWHGGGPIANPPDGGHRLSHCKDPDNPGYILVVVR
jgi:hypothetical protein